MKKIAAFLVLLILLSFQSKNSPLLKNGVYFIDTDHLFSHPVYKIEGNHFKIYFEGHGGSFYGWGTYRIAMEDSMIHFKYTKFVSLHHKPLSKFNITTHKIKNEKGLWIIERYTCDPSENGRLDFDSSFVFCQNYVDASFIDK